MSNIFRCFLYLGHEGMIEMCLKENLKVGIITNILGGTERGSIIHGVKLNWSHFAREIYVRSFGALVLNLLQLYLWNLCSCIDFFHLSICLFLLETIVPGIEYEHHYELNCIHSFIILMKNKFSSFNLILYILVILILCCIL